MQPDLENLKKRISESRDLVDRVITKLPGYSGYVEKGEMNEADRVVRGFIAERFLQYKRIVEAVTREYSRQGNMTLPGGARLSQFRPGKALQEVRSCRLRKIRRACRT